MVHSPPRLPLTCPQPQESGSSPDVAQPLWVQAPENQSDPSHTSSRWNLDTVLNTVPRLRAGRSIHPWHYSPFWALAFLKSCLHSSPFSALLRLRVSNTCNASFCTASSHLILGLPTGLVLWNFLFRTSFGKGLDGAGFEFQQRQDVSFLHGVQIGCGAHLLS
jgi:hypothetical protein